MLVFFMVIWNILLPFGIFICNSVYFPPVWYIVARKIWQPLSSYQQLEEVASRRRRGLRRLAASLLEAGQQRVTLLRHFQCSVKSTKQRDRLAEI
jgi:hypothetical protein